MIEDFVARRVKLAPLLRASVLIIEDNPLDIEILKEIFNSVGLTRIHVATSGDEGIKMTHDLEPDLVILDLNLPVVTGEGYIDTIKSQTKFEDLPVIVVTGKSDNDLIQQTFLAGASDFIIKPVNSFVFLAKTLIHLERQHHLRELHHQEHRVHEELNGALRLQQQALPSEKDIKTVDNLYNISIASHFAPTSEVAGDFWGVKGIDDQYLAVYNVDFTGHGFDAAMNTFRLHTLINSHSPIDALDPAKYASWLSDCLMDLIPREHFATFFYGVIDCDNNLLNYTTCGCPNPIIFHKSEDLSYQVINGKGVPLGIVREPEYETKSLPFTAGDTLLLYSDALTETPDNQKEFLDQETLINKIYEDILCADAPLDEATDAFASWFFKEYGANVRDDFTISLIQRKLG